MAKIVITSATHKIIIKYNDLSAKYKQFSNIINRHLFVCCMIVADETAVQLELSNGTTIVMKADDVDTFGGGAVTDNSDLANKFTDLML